MIRSVSVTLVSPSVGDLGKDSQQKVGRWLLGGVRRSSLVGSKKHKQNKSGGTFDVLIPLPPPALDIRIRPSIDKLLPPIELQPSSLPHVLLSLSAPHLLSFPMRLPTNASPQVRSVDHQPPQSASLGLPTAVSAIAAAAVPRRSSLGIF